MGKKTIDDVDVSGKRVLLRVDFNVPLSDETGEITDDKRIRASLPTIRRLIENDARVIIMSHLGRPAGKVNEKMRLNKVAEHLSVLLDRPVRKMDDCIGPAVEAAVAELKNGDVMVLENVRFYPEEEKNDANFAKQLVKLGDIFVSDAFGTAHRAHCSTEGVGQFLPSVAGYLMKQEISALAKVILRPKRPFVAIIGGAKISDKIRVIENLVDKADVLIIGGGMANTFLAAQGYDMKKSLVEESRIETAKRILQHVKETNKQLLLPTDMVVAYGLDDNQHVETVAVDALKDGQMALDIGPDSIALFREPIGTAQTIMWNGPMGVFEKEAFAHGTNALAQAVADSDAYSIVGGGDSVAAIHQAGLETHISHISTGGGASLAFMEGSILPGLAILDERDNEERTMT